MFTKRESVGTTATQIFKIPVSLQALTIYAVGALEIRMIGVAVGTGLPLSAGDAIEITHRDFCKDPDIQESDIEIYAVASVATTIQVLG